MRPDGPAEGEGDGRHVGPEADLVGVGGAEQVGRGDANVVDELVGLEAGREGAPVVGVAGEEVVVDGAQAGVHDLRAGRTVEPGDRLPVGSGPAQRGEAGADGVDVPVSHGLESSRRGRRSSCASGYRARVAGPRVPTGMAQESEEARRVTDEQRPAGGGPEIEHLMAEGRLFPPDPGFRAAANAGPDLYRRAEEDPEAFWADLARQKLRWMEPFSRTLSWEPPFARWFEDGRLNVTDNCLDRHVEAGLGDKVAYHWIGEPGDTRTLTYADLHREVQRAANALLELGIRSGDRVAIYMPMIPELPIAMLACARIGAPHTVVFGGFSAEALASRIDDAQARLLITADGGWRRGRPVDLKSAADEALEQTTSVEHVLVVRRLGEAAPAVMQAGRDVWWHDIVDRQAPDCPPAALEAEHMLFLLYTSGTTAKPKGIMHTTAGYLLGASVTHEMVFDLKPDDVYWCAADIGWVTGHSYIVYGPAGQRGHRRPLRGRPGLRPPGSAGGRSSRSTGSPSCTRRPRPSAPS